MTTYTNSGITTFVRLEPRSKQQEFSKTLQGSVHDGLWMLTQQYRTGEFNGEDACSLISANIKFDVLELSKYQSDAYSTLNTLGYTTNIPLEAFAERLPFNPDLALRIQIGTKWLKFLDTYIYPNHAAQNSLNSFYCSGAYLIQLSGISDPRILSDQQEMLMRRCSSGKIPDGYLLYQAFKTDLNKAAQIAGVTVNTTLYTQLGYTQSQFCSWYETTYLQPVSENTSAWDKKALDYKFKVSGGAALNSVEKVIECKDYHGGKLEWHDFTLNNTVSSINATAISEESLPNKMFSFIPSPLKFKGMPVERWWEFEDRNDDLGAIKDIYDPAKMTNLPLLSIFNFAYNYSNDWFIVPISLKRGCIYEIKEFKVKNVFDTSMQEIQISDQNQWSMFNLNRRTGGNGREILVTPNTPKLLESSPIEKVKFMRDEMANIVWGIEEIIPNAFGGGMDSKLAEQNLHDYLLKEIEENTVGSSSTDAELNFHIMNTVPENWIPFIPFSNNQSNRQIVLKRATLLRVVDGKYATEEPVRPRSILLSEGLNQSTPQGYEINEEEILRSGVTITTYYQRTRWYNGKIFTWLGRRRTVGKGEGSSNLKYDYFDF